jgi:hypothetical protein
MACQRLATEYLNQNPKASPIPSPIPDGDTSTETLIKNGNWLLKQTRYCRPTQGDPTDITKLVHFSNPICDNHPRSYYRDEGFLNFVNIHGLQCIHQVTGKFVGYTSKDIEEEKGFLNPDTNINMDPIPESKAFTYEKPGVQFAYPVSHCTLACLDAKPGQLSCFECVKDKLQDITRAPVTLQNPNPADPANENKLLCRDGYGGSNNNFKDIDISLMDDALKCTQCIGENSKNISVKLPPKSLTPADWSPSGLNQVYGCITGDFPDKKTHSGLIIGIVAGLVLVFLIGVLVYHFVKRRQAVARLTNKKIIQKSLDSKQPDNNSSRPENSFLGENGSGSDDDMFI